jgi:predicted amidohydrolase
MMSSTLDPSAPRSRSTAKWGIDATKPLDGGIFYFGESLVVDPRGEIVAHGSASEEDLVWADLDLKLLGDQRKTWSFLDGRRPDLYGILGEPVRGREEVT